MAKRTASILPAPSPEHRRIAAGQFDHANQVIATGKSYDYGIRLLLSCCKLDPANLIYRQALRRTQKLKYNHNMRGSWIAWLTAIPAKAKLKRAKQGRDWLLVLEVGELVLTRNPWEVGTQMDMAEAADHLGLLDMAIWMLVQARQKARRNPGLNRFLARLYEQRGNFKEAIKLWEKVHRADPNDTEAASKSKDLAAHETIARGNYEEALGGASLQDEVEQEPPSGVWRKPVDKATDRNRAGKNRSEDSAVVSADAPASQRNVGPHQSLLDKIEQDPSNPHPYLELAGVYRRTEQLEKARELLKRGIALTGSNFEMMTVLADLEIEPFRRNLAITEQRLTQNEDDEELRRIRIRLLKEINARELELFRQKADRYPADLSHRFELGVRLLRGGSTDEAIQALQAARSDPRVLWCCALYLGHCFKARNNWRLAKRNYEDALKFVPAGEEASRKEILFHLAQGCAENDELTEAIDWAHELANLDFGYRSIGGLLDDWQTQLKQTTS